MASRPDIQRASIAECEGLVSVAKPLDVMLPMSGYQGGHGLNTTGDRFHAGSRAVDPLERVQAPLRPECVAEPQLRRIYQPSPSIQDPWKNVCISGFAPDVLAFENDSQVSS